MEDELKPMTEGDIAPAQPDAPATPDELAKDAAAPVAAPEAAAEPDKSAEPEKPAVPMTVEGVKQQAKAHAGQISQQASDKALLFAEQGKDRAVGALEQLSQMIEDAAAQVDEKIGGGNGQYVRTAAGTVQGFADQLRDRKVDDLVDEARTLVRKSPGIAIGAAAAVGFVVARLVSAGIDQRDA